MQIGEFILRPDQERTIAKARQAVAQCFAENVPARVLIQAPCGSGKTILSSALMHGALEKQKRTAFIVMGRQLVNQKCDKLERCRIPHSIMMRGEQYYQSQVTVCSFHTYIKRVSELGIIPAVDPDVWVIDEAHNFKSELALKQVDGASVVIGFSATPADTRNGCGLGWWTKLVTGPTHAELLKLGLLCPPRVFAPFVPDLSQLSLGDEEWSEPAVSKIFNQKVLIGDVVLDWQRLGEDRATACFASSVEHSLALRDEFRARGISAEHMDADTPPEERADIFRQLRNGDVKVVCNFGVLTVGWDEPCVSCGILAFATNSVVKYIQVCGRMLRPFPGKKDALIIDHGANVDRHGWPTEDRDWTLNTERTIRESDEERREREKKPREPVCCPKCGAMRESGPKCLNCGYEHKKTGLKMRMQDGTLREIKRRKPKRVVSDHQKAWMRILAACAYKGLPCNAALAIFKREYQKWPNEFGIGPDIPREKGGLKVRDVFPGFVRRKKAAT